MKVVYVFVCALFYSAVALASGTESCPAAGDVTMRAGVYTAPSSRAGDEWVAVSSAAVPSQLETFEGAVFYPQDNQPGAVGRIGYCEYKARDRSRVNLHYRQSAASERSMRFANTENWRPVESGLGLVVYECNAAIASNCAFSIVD